MSLRKRFSFLILLVTSIISCNAYANQSGALEAYACKDCSLEQAEALARLLAPINSCDIWEKGPEATFCEPVSKEVFILSHETKDVFKFNVTTTINSQNTPTISVWNMPVLAFELDLSHDYFTLYAELENAVIAAQDKLMMIQPSEVSTHSNFAYHSMGSVTQDSCENHPTHFFKSVSNQRAIISELVGHVASEIGNSTWAEFTYERFVGGGSIGLSKGSGSIGVSLQFHQNNMAITKKYGPGNYLSFQVFALTNVATSNSLMLDLRLNKSFSKIDGVPLATLFANKVDLTDTVMSNCWREFLKEESEPVSTPPGNGGGSGTIDDPFLSGGSHDAGSYCVIRRSVTTCSTDRDGDTRCVKSTVSWTDFCDLF
ncbi:hypothetical protein ACO1PK_05950 [Alishewanella sp. d11]|uniref:hypothetical protein n=1 Tax=Alishewanella sp. d11 TaxID=3414030 RepID=UPI003BF82FD9